LNFVHERQEEEENQGCRQLAVIIGEWGLASEGRIRQPSLFDNVLKTMIE